MNRSVQFSEREHSLFCPILIVLIFLLGTSLQPLSGQTIMLAEDFETNSISTSTGNYPYKNTNSCSSIFGWYSSTSFSAGCSSCSNQAARVRITSSCPGFKTAYLYVGTFTPSSSTVDISFDYGYKKASGITSSFRVVLRNLSQSTESNLVYHASTAENQSYSSPAAVTPGDQYEIRLVFFASNYYSFSHNATFDNLMVTNPCTTPVATLSTVDDCANDRFQVQVSVNNTGSGSAVDILANAANAYTNVGTGTYLLPSPTTYYTKGDAQTVEVTAAAHGGCTGPTAVLAGCQADICIDALDVLGQSESGVLEAANIDAPPALLPSFLGCGNGSTVAQCGGASHSAYDYTDFRDLWYLVDIPDGSNEFTLSFSNLTGPIMILPYTGACNSLTQLPIDNSATSTTGGNCPVMTGNGDFTFSEVAAYSTAPIYLRIIPHDNGAFGATGCTGNAFNYASFDLIASAPQPNDICADAPDITVNNGGAVVNSDLSLAANESTPLPASGFCGTDPLNTSGTDLWYAVNMPAAGPVKNIELSLTFQNPGESVYAYLYDGGCYDYGSPEDCRLLSSVNAGETVTVSFNPGSLLLSSKNYLIRLLRPSSGGLTQFSAEAKIFDQNNDCEVFNAVNINHRLFDGTLPITQTADFTFASNSEVPYPSGGLPTAFHSDLWFTFDPVLTTDGNGLVTWSGFADLSLSGLAANEELALLLYRRNGYSGNCVNYSNDFVDSLQASTDGTFRFNCMDYDHGSSGVGDGYIVRVVQVAGTGPANIQLSASPADEGSPTNDLCSAIFNGTSPTFEGGFYDITQDTLSGNFTWARSCEGISDTCSGISLAKPKDLWYVLTLPSASCPDLSVSTRITSAEIWYDAGSSFRDAYVYVYSDCASDSILGCGSLDGAGESLEVNGLEPGTSYLVRVMPHFLNSNDTYAFQIGSRLGPERPCNDQPLAAEVITGISTGFDRSACPTLTLSAQGATETANIADGKHDVWFSFTAPNNGGPYVTQKGYLSIYLESVSGHTLTLEVYDLVSEQTATNRLGSANTDSFDEARLHLGHLTPGENYYLRVAHSEPNLSNNNVLVQYRLCLYQDQPVSGCPQTGTNLLSTGIECTSSCTRFYKIDLPENLPSAYYRFEVVGDGIAVDARVRYQGMDAPSNEGNLTDIDHACNAGANLPLESSGPLAGSPTCNGGSGVWKVYNLIGPVTGQRNYYYLEAYHNTQVVGCGGLDLCQVRIFGPYTTQLLAEASGAPDLNCNSALPVEWLAFEGTQAGQDNRLSWSVASQFNVDQYRVERSDDGATFLDLGVVLPHGQQGAPQSYSFLDEDVTGNHYYRIRSVDQDGTSTLSQTLFLQGQNQTAQLLEAYPNPASSYLKVKWQAGADHPVQILLIDAQGRSVQQQQLIGTGAPVEVGFQVEGLASGLYLLRIEENGHGHSKRIVIQ